MAFKDQRRQKYLSEKSFAEESERLVDGIARARKILAEDDLVPDAISSFKWRISSNGLQHLLLNYTAGHSIAELADQLPAVIQGFEESIPTENPPPNEAYTLDITQLEAYVYVMWLLALCKLLGHAELIPTVIGWLDRRAEWNRGRDAIFEQIVKKLTGDMVDAGRQALHIEAYRPLGHAILADNPADRPALVKEFVEKWYKHMKDCYWHGAHSDGGVSYFGYWCLEAALVTYLWDIDDSSYRDHLVYPKDLVDFARGLSVGVPQTPRCPGGEACPRSGWWSTPAAKNSRRYFKQGDVMPRIEGSSYGDTYWQWDANQETPKL